MEIPIPGKTVFILRRSTVSHKDATVQRQPMKYPIEPQDLSEINHIIFVKIHPTIVKLLYVCLKNGVAYIMLFAVHVWR